MPEYAVVLNGQFVERRFYPNAVPANQIKHVNGVPQLRPYTLVKPSFDSLTEKLTGPEYTITDSLVTETWTKVSQTAQEISDRKDATINVFNGGYAPLLKALLSIVNDIRANRAKINALIDATGQAGTVPKYLNGQTTQIDMTQLKNAIKALL